MPLSSSKARKARQGGWRFLATYVGLLALLRRDILPDLDDASSSVQRISGSFIHPSAEKSDKAKSAAHHRLITSKAANSKNLPEHVEILIANPTGNPRERVGSVGELSDCLSDENALIWCDISSTDGGERGRPESVRVRSTPRDDGCPECLRKEGRCRLTPPLAHALRKR